MNTLYTKGSVTLLALIFGAIFLLVLTALASYTLSLNRAQDAVYDKYEASAIAEAGLDYYEWYLGQNPTNTTQPDPATTPYDNLEGAQVGTYTLSIVPDTACPGNTAFDISSLGTPSDAPDFHTTISLVYIPAGGVYASTPDCTPAATSTEAAFLNWQEQ